MDPHQSQNSRAVEAKKVAVEGRKTSDGKFADTLTRCRFRIRVNEKKSDPDPHQSEKTDPDPLHRDANPDPGSGVFLTPESGIRDG
jgi:hypothetical protein